MSADAGRTPVAPTPSTPANPPVRGLRKDIQALRALSVLLVVGFHLWPGRISGGFVGVDVFFVISGFLITDHLLRDAGKKGRISLTQFWTRRAFRLLPASLLVIVLTSIATLIWVSEDQWRPYFTQALGSGFYVQNWVLANSSTDYLSASDPPTAFQHFWSLSVEEQFYLILPVLLVLVLTATAARRAWRPVFGVVVGLITLASLAWSIHLTVADPAAAYFVTTTRAWEFGLGALLAFVGSARLTRVHPVFAWVGAAMIAIAGLTYTGDTPFPGYAALLPVVGAVLMLATSRHDRVFDLVANNRPVQLIGDASYSIYLWHWPIVVIAPYALGHQLGFLPRVAILAISLVLGYLSMRFVERSFRAHGFARWRTPSGGAVAGGMVAVLVLGVGGLQLLGHREAASQSAAAQARSGSNPCVGAPALNRAECKAPTTLTPTLALLRNDDGNRDDCWSERADPAIHRCVLSNPKNPVRRAIAVGDSHNGSMLPAYTTAGEDLRWKIEATSKEGCYLATGEVPINDPIRRASCETWRKNLLPRLVADKSIDTVIVTRYDLNLVDGDNREATVAGLRGAWKQLTDAGKKVVVVEDVPRMDQKVLDCVSQNGLEAATKCSVPKSTAFPKFQALRAAADGMKDVSYVPVDDLYCRDDTCPPVIGGVVVFRNLGHVTRTFASTLGHELAPRLRAAD